MNIKNNGILENAQSKRYFNGYFDQLNRPAYAYPDIENGPDYYILNNGKIDLKNTYKLGNIITRNTTHDTYILINTKNGKIRKSTSIFRK